METANRPVAVAVDDDPLILMHVCEILEEAGFRCIEAGSGDEAKPIIEEQCDNITLLFSDVEMPGATNGFALAHHVSNNCPTIEIVIASGRLQPEPGDMPAKATFIPKPFSAEIVRDHLRQKLPDDKKPDHLKI